MALTAVANEALAAVGRGQPDRICIFIPLAKALGGHKAVVNIGPRAQYHGPALRNEAAGRLAVAASVTLVRTDMGSGGRHASAGSDGEAAAAGQAEGELGLPLPLPPAAATPTTTSRGEEEEAEARYDPSDSPKQRGDAAT
jgi:hypothetical protein